LGGTGTTHDWAVSRAIRAAVSVPIYLAGGLTAENVGAAIRTVGPFGVDLCSGVRTDGRLDGGKLARFMAAVEAARGTLMGKQAGRRSDHLASASHRSA
jgi:phosphoribosylanthranilate isomerase